MRNNSWIFSFVVIVAMGVIGCEKESTTPVTPAPSTPATPSTPAAPSAASETPAVPATPSRARATLHYPTAVTPARLLHVVQSRLPRLW